MARRKGYNWDFSSVDRWAKQERKRQERRDRQSDRAERQRKGGAGAAVAKGIITGAVTLGGVVAEPPEKSIIETGDAYERSRSGLVENRDEYLDEQTRVSGERKRGSSRNR